MPVISLRINKNDKDIENVLCKFESKKEKISYIKEAIRFYSKNEDILKSINTELIEIRRNTQNLKPMIAADITNLTEVNEEEKASTNQQNWGESLCDF